jgi:branched-chain amino acid transport system substrate-binding protein
MKKKLILLFLSLLSILMNSSPCLSQPPLKVGTLIPFTGRWGDAGRECARGMMDAAKWLNQQGGVYGRRLEIFLVDDTFQTAETLAANRKLNEVDNILLLYIYSTETALTLLPHIQFNRIPTLVGSLPSHLTDSSKAPYVFSLIPTPLDLAKIGILFISEKSGIKARNPKIAFIGSSDYLDQHFLDEAKSYAKTVGLDVVPDVAFTDLSLSREPDSSDRMDKQIASILSSINQSNPDFAYLSLTSKEVSSIVQGAKKMGLKTRWVCNSRAFDENLTPCDGVLGVQPISFFGEEVPGMAGIKEAHQKWHPYDSHTLFYVEGWATVQVMVEALGRSLPEQRLSRERVKSSLESFRNYVSGGLIPPLTITSDDHRPSVESRILVIKDGKISIQSSFISVPRQKKTLR